VALMPLLLVSAVLLKLLMASHGIPGGFIPFPNVDLPAYYDSIMSQVDTSAAAGKVSSTASTCVQQAATTSAITDDRQLTVSSRSSTYGTIEGSLQEVFELLGKIELGAGKTPAPGWVPQCTGFRRVACDPGVVGGWLSLSLGAGRVRGRVCRGRGAATAKVQ